MRARAAGGLQGCAAEPVRRRNAARPLRIRGHHAVDGLHPGIEGSLNVSDAPAPQQRQEGLKTQPPFHPGGKTQTQGAAVGRFGNDRTTGCLDDLNNHRPTAPDADGFGIDDGGFPAFGSLRLDAFAVVVADPAQFFNEQVLVVGHRVGDGPRGVAGVREVRQARNAGKREAHNVEFRAGQAHLLVDARQLHEAVGVPGDQRKAAGRRRAVRGPGVAAGPDRSLDAEQVHGVFPECPRDVGAEELVGKCGEKDVMNQEDPERCPGEPRLGGAAGFIELRASAETVCQGLVDPGHVLSAPPSGGRREVVEAAARGLVEPGLPGKPVPGQGVRAQHLSGPAFRTPALQLDLPGTVDRRIAALEEGELIGGISPEVRNAPVVAVRSCSACRGGVVRRGRRHSLGPLSSLG